MRHKNIITIPKTLLRQYEEGYLFTFELKFSFDDNTKIAVDFLKETLSFSLYNIYNCQVENTIRVYKIKERKDIFKMLLNENVKKQIFDYNGEEYIVKLKIA